MFFSPLVSSQFLRILLGSALVFLLSCDLKLGESPPEASIPEYKPDTCFSNSVDSFGQFFKGDAKETEIKKSWDCFGSMVQAFKTKVRCKNRDLCTPAEIARFVEDNFIEENRSTSVNQKAISTGLQIQFMKIKRLFLGGDLEHITPAELDGLLKLMSQLRDLSVLLNPSMKVLTLNWENQLKSSELRLFDFEAVNENIIQVAQQFSSLIKSDLNEYEFDDFYNFINEVSAFSGQHWGWVDKVSSYLPLIKKLKVSIAGGDENIIKGSKEWNALMLLGSRAYVQYLRYYYFIKDLDDQSTSLKLAYSARTIEEVFRIFYDLLSFKDSNTITKKEIEDLLSSFSKLWPVVKTSPELVAQIMKLKQVLIGGSSLNFSKDDFQRAQFKTNLMKQIVEKFIPYYQFYGFSWKPELLKQADAYQYFSNASSNLDEIVNKLVYEFKLENGYDLESLISLLDELDRLYPSLKNNESKVNLMEYACLAQIGVDIMLDKNATRTKGKCSAVELTKQDLSVLLVKATQVFSLYQDYYYFLSKGLNYYNEVDLQIKLSDFIKNVSKFVKTTIDSRQNKLISNYEISFLVGELSRLELIPKSIRKNTIDNLIDAFLNRFLVPLEKKNSIVKAKGLESWHITQLNNEIDSYLKMNILIGQVFEDKANYKTDYNSLFTKFTDLYKSSDNVIVKTALAEFLRHFKSPNPFFLTKDGRLLFVKNANPMLDKNSLLAYNLNRFLASLLMRSYATIKNRDYLNAILTNCDANQAYTDLKPILVDLGIVSESSGGGFIDARFVEANLFLIHSDGNDTVTFDELAEFANYILSGFAVEALSKNMVYPRCPTKDEGTDKLVSVSCLREQYALNSIGSEAFKQNKVFSTTPLYLKYFQSEDRSDWNDAFFNYLKTAGYVPRKDLMVSLSDASLLPHIIQYGETIFIKFDKNGDGILDKAEAIGAFPYFKYLLKKVAKKQIESGVISENDLEAVFTFILKYGKIPGCDKSLIQCLFDRDVLRWLNWKYNYKKDSYNLAANRTRIAKILGIISDMVNATPSTPSTAPSCPARP